MQYVDMDDEEDWKGYMLATMMLVSLSHLSFLFNSYFWFGNVAGMKARSLINAVVYRKVWNKSVFIVCVNSQIASGSRVDD